MSYQGDRAAIENYFATQWGALTPVAYDNVQYQPPADGTAWVRFSVLPGESFVVSMGDTRRYRHVGIVDLGIFIPEGAAAKSAMTLADTFSGLFRGVSVGEIKFKAPQMRVVGNRDGWFHVAVSVPYQRDNIFA